MSVASPLKLIVAANKWHRKAEGHERQAIHCANKAGEYLNAAHDQIPHGEWADWLKEHFEGSERRARVYCAIARNWSWLAGKVKSYSVRTIEDASRSIEQHNETREARDNANSGKVRKSRVLEQLESVSPALSRGIIEQSDMFVFEGGRVAAYNDEICMSRECDLPIEGVVAPKPLLSLLSQTDELHLDVEVKKDKVRFKAPNRERQATVRIEPEIRLKLDAVKPPSRWKPLPDEFCEAVDMVRRCAGIDYRELNFLNVHFHPKYLEACDQYQAIRYPLKLGIKSSFLVKADSLRQVADNEVTEYALDGEWIHFRNAEGLVIACRSTQEPYPSLDAQFNATGKAIKLPKGIDKAAKKARLFRSDRIYDLVEVSFGPNGLRISNQNDEGSYSETLPLAYKGKAEAFKVDAKLLMRLSKHEQCLLGSRMLTVNTGKFTYSVCLENANNE